MDDVARIRARHGEYESGVLASEDIATLLDAVDRLRSERDGLAEKARLYDYMQEVAKANGFDCLTDAITKANAYGKERDSLAAELAKVEIKDAALCDLAYANGAQFGMRASESPEMEAQVRRAIERHTSDAIKALEALNVGKENRRNKAPLPPSQEGG